MAPIYNEVDRSDEHDSTSLSGSFVDGAKECDGDDRSSNNLEFLDVCCNPFDASSSLSSSSVRTGFAMDAIAMSSLAEKEKGMEQYCTYTNEELESSKLSSSDFHVQFPGISSSVGDVQVELNGDIVDGLRMKGSSDGQFFFADTGNRTPASHVLLQLFQTGSLHWGTNSIRFLLHSPTYTQDSSILSTDTDTNNTNDNTDDKDDGSSDKSGKMMQKKSSLNHLRKSVRKNTLLLRKKSSSSVTSSTAESGNNNNNNSLLAVAEANLFLWSVHDSIAVSDVDGTVTKSDVTGVFDSILTERYRHVHRGICRLFTQMSSQNIRFVYLTARPIRLAPSTRKFLTSMTQPTQNHDNHQQQQQQQQQFYSLPPGPIFCHPGSLANVLSMELFHKNTYDFKTSTIRQQVYKPFQQIVCCNHDHPSNNHNRNPFVAGFGNKSTDRKAYLDAGIDDHNIYIISKEGVIVRKSFAQSINNDDSHHNHHNDQQHLSEHDTTHRQHHTNNKKGTSRFIPDMSNLFSSCSIRSRRSHNNSSSYSSGSDQSVVLRSESASVEDSVRTDQTSIRSSGMTQQQQYYSGYDDPQLYQQIFQC